MTEFWELSFIEKQTMWGFEPSDSAIITKDFFLEKKVKEVLIPGIGYGRNAKIFQDNGMNVSGIEISKTAIDLAREHYGTDMKIYHGSVTEMPFDDKRYDGIFCFALIHLLNFRQRKKLIQDCYNQLSPDGYMVFTTISKKAPTYKTGKKLSKDRFEIPQGAKLFFYDSDSIKQEFRKFGLIEIQEIDEPVKNKENKPPLPFWLIKCRREI